MKLLSVVVAVMCFSGLAQVPVDHSGEKATLDVASVDSFGRSLSSITLSLRRLDGGGAPTMKIKVGRTLVEYGTYQLTATGSGYELASRTITVEGPYTTAVIALIPGEPEKGNAEPVIRGTVRDPGLSERCPLMRLVPLFAVAPTIDARAYHGEFTVSGAKPGRYAAVLYGPSGPCHVAEITVELRQTQSIVVP